MIFWWMAIAIMTAVMVIIAVVVVRMTMMAPRTETPPLDQVRAEESVSVSGL